MAPRDGGEVFLKATGKGVALGLGAHGKKQAFESAADSMAGVMIQTGQAAVLMNFRSPLPPVEGELMRIHLIRMAYEPGYPHKLWRCQQELYKNMPFVAAPTYRL